MSATATANAPCPEFGATVPSAYRARLHVVGVPTPAVHCGCVVPPLPFPPLPFPPDPPLPSPPGPPLPSPPGPPLWEEQPTAAIATASDQAAIPVCDRLEKTR